MAQALMDAPQYSIPAPEKEAALLEGLNALTRRHRERCPAYARLLSSLWPGFENAGALAKLPFLPVGLFKTHELVSVEPEEVFKILTSSGTTGQAPSRVHLDRATAQAQSHALMRIMTHVLGPSRLPMLIIDTKNLIGDRASFNARGAGVLGMSAFGRKHFYALDDRMELDLEGLESFAAEFSGQPILVFGFTFMVWKYFLMRLEELGLELGQALARATLIHSGGWKKLEEEAVDNAAFKHAAFRVAGIGRVYNFYGMVEQVGSVFLEDEDGFLFPPNFAEIIVRDPFTLEELPPGREGVIQVLSILPASYPGHSLLTEDLGVIHGVDDAASGRKGRYFTVTGRAPRAELRGCSDVHALNQREG